MEQEFLDWLQTRQRVDVEHAAARGGYVLLGIGDDAAVFESGKKPLVIACDSIAQGTHFDLNHHSLCDIGRKAIAVNLSDLAAMGATPLVATLSFQIPRSFSLDEVKEIFLGAEDLANQFDLEIVGGDTNSWDGGLVVGATLVGRAESSFWKMSGAQAGDDIVVTGDFGGSILGHHLKFQPCCELATKLANDYKINGATDVSDSLALDLSRLASASGCGAEVVLAKVPVSEAARVLSARENNNRTALDHALYDGEDFQLILAVPPDVTERLLKDNTINRDLTVIGKFTERLGLIGVTNDGSSKQIDAKGYWH